MPLVSNDAFAVWRRAVGSICGTFAVARPDNPDLRKNCSNAYWPGQKMTGRSCETCLLRQKQCFRQLSPGELRILDSARTGQVDLAAGRFLYRSGDTSKALYTLQDGWAGACMGSPGEPLRLMDVLLPGDLIGVPASISGTHLRSVVALTPIRYCVLDRSLTRQLAEQGGPFAFALMELLVEQRVQRERMSNLLRSGSPLQLLAYFFLETFRRLQSIGTAAETMCPFPLRRSHLAQIVGLSEVHVSRTLAAMRRDNLVDIANNILFIPDEARLATVANVSPVPCPRERLIL